MIWVHQQKLITEKKDILNLGKGPTQGLEETLSVEKMYSINFTKTNTKFVLSLHYNGANSYLFVNSTENIDETRLANITVKSENKDKCRSYMVYKVLFFIFFTIIIVIGVYFVNNKYVNRFKYDLPY